MGEVRSRLKVQVAKANLATFDLRSFSEKIETLYRAKGLERRLEIFKDGQQEASVTVPLSLSLPPPLQEAGCTNGITSSKPAEAKRPRVADMRKIFDGGTNSKSLSTMKTSNTSKIIRPVSDIVESTTAEQTVLITRALPLPSSLPPAYSLTRKRSSATSPKTLPNLLSGAISNHFEQSEESPKAFQPLPVAKRVSPLKSKAIGDKVKLFEGLREEKEVAKNLPPEKKRKSLGRKLNWSLKSLFEPHILRKTEDGKEDGLEKSKTLGKKCGLTGLEIQDVVDEFQDTQSSKSWKSRRLAAAAQEPLAIGQDGAHSEKGLGSPNSLEVSEMIVKEAECGLKQPKPLRVVEMKRMMALCRDRFGSIRHREKGSITTRKL
jgi:hypothetical protein